MDRSKTALSNAGTANRKSMNTSFAYIEGQEAEALSYYEKRLQVTTDPDERKRLDQLVQRLRTEVQKTRQYLPDFSMSGLSLRCA